MKPNTASNSDAAIKRGGTGSNRAGAYSPSELATWYKRQERQVNYDDGVIESVYAWSQRFSGIRSEVFASEQLLWAVLNDMHDALASRTAVVQVQTIPVPVATARTGTVV